MDRLERPLITALWIMIAAVLMVVIRDCAIRGSRVENLDIVGGVRGEP